MIFFFAIGKNLFIGQAFPKIFSCACFANKQKFRLFSFLGRGAPSFQREFHPFFGNKNS